jgi:hypothetical protein
MKYTTKTHLLVKRTGKIHEVMKAREARPGDVEPAYELLHEDQLGTTWYWENEVEAVERAV